MSKVVKFFIVFSITFILFNGCAFTVHQTPVNYQFAGKIQGANESFNKTVSVGEFIDNRDTSTKKMIANMRNGHGNLTTGGWEAEKTIAEIVAGAFEEGMKARSIQSIAIGDYILTGEIMDFILDSKTNSSLAMTLVGKLSVKIQLMNSKDNKIVYRDVFVGKATDNSSGVNNKVKNVFVKSLDNLVEKVMNDSYFIQQFN